MTELPEYIKVDNKKYKINTDFRVALQCDKIAKDNTIGKYEKVIAIIYLLFGEEASKDTEHYEKLLELAIKYLNCGKDIKDYEDEEPDMDFEQDYSLIKASFRTDYRINIDEEKIHWWDFYSYLNGLKEDCVLNRVRELRTYDTKDLKGKEKQKIEKQKRRFALKKETIATDKQKESAEKFFKLARIERRQN